MAEQYFTVAFMAVKMQRPYGMVLAAVARLKIMPSLVLNDTAYFTAADEALIFQSLGTQPERSKTDD
jgi:hypothetical protein